MLRFGAAAKVRETRFTGSTLVNSWYGANVRITPAALLFLSTLACGTAPSADDTGAATTSATATTSSTTGATTDAPTSTTTTSATTGEPAWPDACAEPIAPLARGTARLSVDAGGRLRDEHGRDVQLRGVNTGGRSKYAPFVPFPIDPEVDQAGFTAAADEFFARLPAWGVDLVRMPFSWEALEPTEGSYDTRYLDRYAAMVDAAWNHRIAVIVDFHQDIYASPFCGDGFPPWTIPGEPGPPLHNCSSWGLKYLTDPDVRAAFDRFWADENDLQTKFFAMWDQMITRVGDHPGVLGLEILNEPGWGSRPVVAEWKVDTLLPFWDTAVARFRMTAGADLLVLYDDTGIEALNFEPPTRVRPLGDNLMYAPHLYDGGLINGLAWAGSEPEPPISEIAAFSAENGVAVLLGEFGYGGEAPDGGPEWLARTYDALDVHRLSATQWECSQNQEPWNEEDLSMISVAGEPRPVVDVFVRPRLRALAGTDASFTWANDSMTARWTGDGGVSEIVVPARRFADGPSQLSLETVSGPAGACLTHDRERGEIRVSVPDGATVEVTLE